VIWLPEYFITSGHALHTPTNEIGLWIPSDTMKTIFWGLHMIQNLTRKLRGLNTNRM